MTRRRWIAAGLAALGGPAAAQTAPPADVDEIVVVGRRLNLVGEALSASEGSVGQAEIAARPLLRAGDLLEFVPGLVATQHSGSGKANQYFLRGFNLDHGTDFSTHVDAMPVNMRTHGHGQGYTDINFLIPETVGELRYRKGTYYADIGDFSSAGSARFDIADTLPRGLASIEGGSHGFGRAVIADSVAFGGGDLLYAGEAQVFDGPWDDIEEDVEKLNLLLRYSADVGGGRAHVMGMLYDNTWNSHDQIPQRAVDQGLISEYGSLDTTVGGESSRYSLSGGWTGPALGGELYAAAYAVSSELDLFSNFTYLLDDPVNGDQFQQIDDRTVYGFRLAQAWEVGRARYTVGAEGRYDDIERVALLRTRARQLVGPVRDDAVEESSIGVYGTAEFRFSEQLRAYLGARFDAYDFDVTSRTLGENSGEEGDSTPSLKASVVYQPTQALELYASYGQGFHSNDARGTTIVTDPISGDPAEPVDPLVDSEGAEIGGRVYLTNTLQATAALWRLELDSELLFVGDAGGTEATRPSERTGFEAGLYYFGADRFDADLEVSYTDSRFSDDDPAGEDIPGSIPLVVSAGVTWRAPADVVVSGRVRYFSPYPLIEDDSVESDGSTLVNLRFARDWGRIGVFLDVFNASDSDDHDIDYFYASRLPGEPEDGVEDNHFNILQKRSLRAGLSYRF